VRGLLGLAAATSELVAAKTAGGSYSGAESLGSWVLPLFSSGRCWAREACDELDGARQRPARQLEALLWLGWPARRGMIPRRRQSRSGLRAKLVKGIVGGPAARLISSGDVSDGDRSAPCGQVLLTSSPPAARRLACERAISAHAPRRGPGAVAVDARRSNRNQELLDG
jgi:hypothetical protein